VKQQLRQFLKRRLGPSGVEFLKRCYRWVDDRFIPVAPKKSYAQLGEDLIIDGLVQWMKIPRPYYLDLGAHHPTLLSNTYYFYLRGAHGVCAEPDPFLCRRFRRKRPRDTVLNVGVGTGPETVADFYVMMSRGLNTFSREEAKALENAGEGIVEVLKIPLVNVNDLIAKHCQRCPEFVSVDVEGLDFALLQSFDFGRYRPEVFCVETMSYSTTRKEVEVVDFMRAKDYVVFADTYLNTIFVDRAKFLAVRTSAGMPTEWMADNSREIPGPSAPASAATSC
jgi:FkbM family methyltransferase